jgi:hypothetical protein
VSWVTPEQFATKVVENVCDLSDYTSPDDQPDLLQCTVGQLQACVMQAFEHFDSNFVMPPPTPPAKEAGK